MKRACLALVILLLISPAVIAQDDKPVKPQAIELMALYKKAGRSWTHRVIHSIRGESPDVETSTTRVTRFEDDKAHCVTESQSADRSRFSTSRFTIDPADVPEEAQAWGDAELPEETLDAGFRKFACKKHQVKGEVRQTTAWISIEFHPLIVKQVTIEAETTSIRKLTAFNAAEVDPWQLYRLVGRSFKLKGMEGDDVKAYFQSTVTKSDIEGADMEVVQTDADGKQVGETTTARVDFTKRLGLVVPGGVDEVEPAGEEIVTVGAGEFECYIVELKEWKLYFSKTWVELPVKVEMGKGSFELVEFDLGHDAHKFYRTAGNFYEMTHTLRTANFNSDSRIRYEVKSVEDNTCAYEMQMLDAKGKVTFSNEMKMEIPVAEKGQRQVSAAYAGQIEDMVATAAGVFPALRVESEGSTSWLWNGIVIRMEMKTKDVDSTLDLSVLNWQ
jgi:hypothetical protein